MRNSEIYLPEVSVSSTMACSHHCSDVTAMSQTHSQSQAHSHCDVTQVLHKQHPVTAGRAT